MTASPSEITVPLFELGAIRATSGALGAFDLFEEIRPCIIRHACGDYGDICDEDKAANTQALADGTRIVSAYELAAGRLFVITEHDRSATTAMLSEEY